MWILYDEHIYPQRFMFVDDLYIIVYYSKQAILLFPKVIIW